MHVPDSLRNLAIGIARRMGDHDARKHVDGSGKRSRAQLLDVLDAYDGTVTYRFLCPDGVADLKVWDADGNEVEAASIELTDPTAAEESELGRIVSIALPLDIKPFWVGADVRSKVNVRPRDIWLRRSLRDALMVNPGIDASYPRWVRDHESHLGRACDGIEAEGPLFSIIVPLYKTPIGFFDAMVESVIAQVYGKWELVLVNASPDDEELRQALDALEDDRVVVVELDGNKGISENTVEGIKASNGDYLAFLDHDDVIEPDLLCEYAKAIIEDPDIDLLYCDEDSITYDGERRFSPSFKFDFNLDLMLTHNFVCHMLAVSRRALDQVTIYDSSVDGAQDYDLALKVSRVARSIGHIPKVLYHWRNHEGSTNGGMAEVKPYVIESSINVLSRYLREDGIEATVTDTELPCVFEVDYPSSDKRDVSVLIAYRSGIQLLECLDSLSQTDHGCVSEVIAIGPDLDMVGDVLLPLGMQPAESDYDADVACFLGQISGMKVKLLHADADGFAACVDDAVRQASMPYAMIVDAAVRFVAGSSTIRKLRDQLGRRDVGIASAKVMSLDGLTYHVGLCVKDDGSIGYLNQGFIDGMGGGYHGCAECACDYSAVDLACMMIRKSDLIELGGFSAGYESPLATAVDYSFKTRQAGMRVVVVPQAKVEIKPIDGRWVLGQSYLKPGDADHAGLWSKWGDAYRKDVLHNPNLDLSSSYFRLKT